MLTFTLDTNCIIAVEDNRPEASHIQRLAEAHSQKLADVSLVAISASEKQKSGGYNATFEAFQEKVKNVGFSHLSIILPMCYFGVSYWNNCFLTSKKMLADEYEIHKILFPNREFNLQSSDPSEVGPDLSSKRKRWQNAKCDVQALWSHIHAKREVFVTTDPNFHKPSHKPRLIALGAGRIEYPETAAALLF